MATITKTYTFVDATTAEASEVNTNFDTIYNEFNGSITNANISATAAIAGSKLDLTSVTTMTTSGNVTIGGTLTQTGVATFTVDPVLSTGGVVTRINTATLTNKRVTKRTGTTTSSATPTINTDNVDFYSITAQAEAITSFTTNLSGTPTENQTLWIAITGTAARAITWGASFEASTTSLPTTTVTTARLDVGFVWNTVTSKWRCMASA